MDVDALITSGDRDRVFADWGVAVVLRDVAQSYDPKAGLLQESFTDYGVTAVIGSTESQPAKETAGQHAIDEAVFLIRAEDVPDGVELRTSRVLHDGSEFRVMSTKTAATGGIIALSCRLI